MLIFYFLSLLIAIFAFNYFIGSGVRTGIHRLLPMTLVAIALHNICQMGFLFTGRSKMFVIFDDLLMLEILYLLTHYIREFYYMRFKKKGELVLSVSLTAVGIIALFQYQYPEVYSAVYVMYTNIYLLVLMVAATHILSRTHFSKNERKVVTLLYVALMAAGIALLFRKSTLIPGALLCSIVYDFVSLGSLYLMSSGRLMDDATLMQSNLFDTSDVAMVLFDPDYYLVEANRVARLTFPEWFGKSKSEEQEQQLGDYIRTIRESEENISEIEVNGRFFKNMIEDYTIRGELRGYVLTIVDISEEMQQVQQFEKMKNQAEDQNVLKSKFLANMSHDLRSPLHAVMGASDVLLSKNDLTATSRSYVQMIKKSSKVLLDLVNEILLYSKLEAGKLVLLKNPYMFGNMLKDLAQMMAMNLSAKPVEFLLSFDTEYPMEVIGDHIRVREILQNILSNAVKFTEEGRITCHVSCKPEVENGRVKFSCEISDTGPGMSKEQLDMIFNEYASFASQRNKEGTGLGMSIVRQLTSLMGGSVRAESDGHSGSTITASFYQEIEKDEWLEPISYEKKDLIKRKTSQEPVDLPGVAFMDAQVLVVDDLDVNLRVFEQIAARWGIKPDTADSGKKAIQMVKEKTYHLIFLDLMMPEMDGIETAAVLKELTDAPMILLTADASDETKRRSKEAGFAEYMCKPMENTYLEANLEKYIPVTYRVAVNKNANVMGGLQNEEMLLAQRDVLETVVSELKHLYEHLPQYQKEDMAMFRIKVHGMKGFTRQINRLGISRQAEIMEMAARLDNKRFIKENIDDFLLEIKETIEEITAELETLPKREVRDSGETVAVLLEQLKEAFDDFDLKKAEECVKQLETRTLSEAENELLEKCRQACEEIEYEMGSELLETYLKEQ